MLIATVRGVFDPTGSFALQCDVKDGPFILGSGLQSESAGGFDGWLTLTFTAGASVPAAGSEIGLGVETRARQRVSSTAPSS